MLTNDSGRLTGKLEVIPGPEVGFEEIAVDFLQARFWIVSGFADNTTQYYRVRALRGYNHAHTWI
jgi:hypothetical protein